jgi:hypothetical protein
MKVIGEAALAAPWSVVESTRPTLHSLLPAVCHRVCFMQVAGLEANAPAAVVAPGTRSKPIDIFFLQTLKRCSP